MSIFRRCLLFQIEFLMQRNVSANVRSLPLILNKLPERNVISFFHTSPWYKKRRKTAEERKANRIIEFPPKPKAETIDVWRNITLRELSQVLQRDLTYVKELFLNKIGNPDTSVTDFATLQNAIKRAGKRVRIIAKPSSDSESNEKQRRDATRRPPSTKDDLLKPRPPVVTVMGHVDHGKTTLLDALRKTNVVAGEFGGITQHIGAFSVVLNESGSTVTFLDTPGHAAFTSMRERGANVTDIVILVVAADDGVMEQTVESIRMSKEAGVTMIVAINKIDSPKADVEGTKKMLLNHGIQVESYGGDIQAIPISALKKQNLSQLIEALQLQAELLELKADYQGLVEAIVIESRVDPHRGRLCTIIVQRGILKKGDILVAGTSMCKVRNMKNSENSNLNEVKPGFSAEIEGWRELPDAGDLILQVENEKRAREVLRIREEQKWLEKQEQDAEAIARKEAQHLQEYKDKLALKRRMGRYKVRPTGPRKPEIPEDDENRRKLSIILKTDVDGTLEAVLETLDTYDSSLDTDCNCEMDLVNYGIGTVTENDIELAKLFKSIIYTFNLNVNDRIKKLAETSNVIIKEHNVIYKLIDDVKNEINLKLPPKEVEEILGEAQVLKQFEINDGRKKVAIAGCRCIKGHLKRAANFRLMRNGQVVHEGTLCSMRHLKNEVDVIKKETECGLQMLDKTITYEEGDTLVCYETKMEPRKTKWNPGF